MLNILQGCDYYAVRNTQHYIYVLLELTDKLALEASCPPRQSQAYLVKRPLKSPFGSSASPLLLFPPTASPLHGRICYLGQPAAGLNPHSRLVPNTRLPSEVRAVDTVAPGRAIHFSSGEHSHVV